MNLNKEQHDEMCASLASLILADSDAELNEENVAKLITASGNETEVYWPMLICKLFANKTCAEIVVTKQGGGGGGGGGGDGGGGGGGGDAVEEEKKEEDKEEEADIGGGDMFGGGDGDDY